MKKYMFIFSMLLWSLGTKCQTAYDLFDTRQPEITYLGIDFSHVKLIGNFTEFMEAGNRNVMEIRDKYFPAWNKVVVNERDKFDIGGMLRKSEVFYDIEMISMINSKTNLEEMEALNCGKYTLEDIQGFASGYDLSGKKGIGVVFIAECLNKSAIEGVFHFVAINMETGKVIFQRRLKAEPYGFGLRNYWINSLHKIIDNISYYYFSDWKSTAEELKGKEI